MARLEAHMQNAEYAFGARDITNIVVAHELANSAATPQAAAFFDRP